MCVYAFIYCGSIGDSPETPHFTHGIAEGEGEESDEEGEGDGIVGAHWGRWKRVGLFPSNFPL